MRDGKRGLLRRLKLAVLVTTAAIGLDPVAFADDGKIHAGSECVPANPAQDAGKIQHSIGDTQHTDSQAAAVTVSCPAIREYGDSTEGDLTDVDVNISAPSGRTVHCWIFSTNQAGTSWTSGDDGVTGGGDQLLDLPLPATTWTNGAYYLECSLEYQTRIRNYLTLENGP